MKNEPIPAIHMEKQLGWAHELGKIELQGTSMVGQTVLGRLVESQIWQQLAGSVALWLCREMVQKRDNSL